MKELDLQGLTIAELSPRIRKKEISPVELTKLFLGRIERLNPVLNAYVTLTRKQALADIPRITSEFLPRPRRTAPSCCGL